MAFSRAGELSEANNSIKDLKLKLEGLEKTLSEAKAREGTLAKNLEAEKRLRKNETANHKDFAEAEIARSTALKTSPAGSPRSWPPWGCQM